MELPAYSIEIHDDANATLSSSNWLFITQPLVLQADWLMLVNNEKATLHRNNMPYSTIYLANDFNHSLSVIGLTL